MDNMLSTKLREAVLHNRPKEVQFLLMTGLDPNAKNTFGNTLLITAAAHGHTEVVRILLEAGADQTIESERGTAMGFALKGEHWGAFSLLYTNAGYKLLSCVAYDSPGNPINNKHRVNKNCLKDYSPNATKFFSFFEKCEF